MYDYPCTLVRVIDADTVELLVDLGFRVRVQEKFRLARINAPEVGIAEGRAAKTWLEAFLAGKSLRVRSRKPTMAQEKYGRWLALLFADGEDVGECLTVAGHATRYEPLLLVPDTWTFVGG